MSHFLRLNDEMGGGILTWPALGTSSGLGRELVHAALNAGQRVIATSRTLESIQDIVPESEYDILS